MGQPVVVEQHRPTRLWYIAPLLFSIIGGIIGYVVVRKRDKQLAIRLLIVGIVMFVLSLIVDLYAFSYMMPGS